MLLFCLDVQKYYDLYSENHVQKMLLCYLNVKEYFYHCKKHYTRKNIPLFPKCRKTKTGFQIENHLAVKACSAYHFLHLGKSDLLGMQSLMVSIVVPSMPLLIKEQCLQTRVA